MKLTRRQEEFIENLIDLSRESDGPIHYSMLAERLGVSPFTAYDMLRLLEEKGMVTSEYQIAEGKSGPGRAERLFCPIMTPEPLLAKKFGTNFPNRMELLQFHSVQIPKKEVAEELLSLLPPDGPDHIRYCLELLMVIALRLRQHTGQQMFLTYLSDIIPAGGEVSSANLSLLGGFAFGILAQEETTDQEWSQILLEHVLQYQEIVRTLAPDERRLLADELMMIFSHIPASLESSASLESATRPVPTTQSVLTSVSIVS